jgi:hypothetical protein
MKSMPFMSWVPMMRPAPEERPRKAVVTSVSLGVLDQSLISYPSPNSTKRSVELAWVEGWEDRAGLFLITFSTNQPALLTEVHEEEEPFRLFGQANPERREVKLRKGQQRFKCRVLQRYGPHCAFCGLSVIELLEAADNVPILAHIGSS